MGAGVEESITVDALSGLANTFSKGRRRSAKGDGQDLDRLAVVDDDMTADLGKVALSVGDRDAGDNNQERKAGKSREAARAIGLLTEFLDLNNAKSEKAKQELSRIAESGDLTLIQALVDTIGGSILYLGYGELPAAVMTAQADFINELIENHRKRYDKSPGELVQIEVTIPPDLDTTRADLFAGIYGVEVNIHGDIAGEVGTRAQYSRFIFCSPLTLSPTIGMNAHYCDFVFHETVKLSGESFGGLANSKIIFEGDLQGKETTMGMISNSHVIARAKCEPLFSYYDRSERSKFEGDIRSKSAY